MYARSRTPRLQWFVAAAWRATACKGNDTGHHSSRFMRAKHELNHQTPPNNRSRKLTRLAGTSFGRGYVPLDGPAGVRRGGRLKRQRPTGWQPQVHPRVEGESLYVHDKGPGENAAFMRCQSDCCQGDQYKHPSHFMRRKALSTGRAVRSTPLISVARTWHVGARKGRGVRGTLGVTHVDG